MTTWTCSSVLLTMFTPGLSTGGVAVRSAAPRSKPWKPALELVGVEERVQEDVGQEIDGERQVLVEDLDVEAGVLLGGEGVHLAADRVHRAGDRLGAARGGPLEYEVLDQVGHPATVLGLVA